MLGAFLGEDLTAVPAGVAAFVAEQLGIGDPACSRGYAERPMTACEHQWEIGRECGYREFAAGEVELRAFLGARVWAVEEGPRALLDRSVLWLIEHRVLLAGITVARLVALPLLSGASALPTSFHAQRRKTGGSQVRGGA
jgi:hypothetical protein